MSVMQLTEKYCEDKSVPAVVIVGLALHKETLGAPLCPCRHYENKELEVPFPPTGWWFDEGFDSCFGT